MFACETALVLDSVTFIGVGSSEMTDFINSSIYCFFRPGRLALPFVTFGDGGVGSMIDVYESGNDTSATSCLALALRSRFPFMVSFWLKFEPV